MSSPHDAFAHAYQPVVAEAGLAVDEQYGFWDRQPLTAASPEIIMFARRAG